MRRRRAPLLLVGWVVVRMRVGRCLLLQVVLRVGLWVPCGGCRVVVWVCGLGPAEVGASGRHVRLRTRRGRRLGPLIA